MPHEPEQLVRERLRSGYVMPLALVSGIKEAEPHLVKQLLAVQRNRKGPWFYGGFTVLPEGWRA